jgi:hypothetical protein
MYSIILPIGIITDRHKTCYHTLTFYLHRNNLVPLLKRCDMKTTLHEYIETLLGLTKRQNLGSI